MSFSAFCHHMQSLIGSVHLLFFVGETFLHASDFLLFIVVCLKLAGFSPAHTHPCTLASNLNYSIKL